MLSPNLEKTLRNAYQLATNNKHEFVTLEHLLSSLTDDEDAIIDTLDALGFGDLMMTLPNEMRMFIDTNSDLEKTYFGYLNAEPEAV